jgi:hypothetical protein
MKGFALRGASTGPRPSISACITLARWLARLRTFSFTKARLMVRVDAEGVNVRLSLEGQGRLAARCLNSGLSGPSASLRIIAGHDSGARGLWIGS